MLNYNLDYYLQSLPCRPTYVRPVQRVPDVQKHSHGYAERPRLLHLLHRVVQLHQRLRHVLQDDSMNFIYKKVNKIIKN